MMHSRELTQALVEQSPDAIVFADPAGVIRVWNAAAERVFGFSADEAVGKRLDLIIPERFREAHARGFARAMAARATKYAGRSLPTRAMRADGTPIYVELSFSIVLDEQGGAIGALACARDITERFKKEREDAKRLQALEQALQNGAGPKCAGSQ